MSTKTPPPTLTTEEANKILDRFIEISQKLSPIIEKCWLYHQLSLLEQHQQNPLQQTNKNPNPKQLVSQVP